jgi:hypothetical protein
MLYSVSDESFDSKMIKNLNLNLVKVFIKMVKHKGQGHKVNILVPVKRSCHKEHSCEISTS